MSFASDTKNELARIEPEKKCCMLSEIAAYIRTAGSIGIVGFGKLRITITTDNAAVARHYKKLIKTYFDIDTNLEDEKYLKGSDKLARIRLAKKTMYNNVVRVRPGESYKGYIVFRNNFRQRGDCTLNLPLLYNNGNVAEEFEFNYQLTKKRQ